MKRILLLILIFLFTVIPYANAAQGNEIVYEKQEFRITVPNDWKNLYNGWVSPNKYPGFYILTSPFDCKIGPNPNELLEKHLASYKKLMTDNKGVFKDKSLVKISNRDVTRTTYIDETNTWYFMQYVSFGQDFSFQILVKGNSSQLDKDRKTLEHIFSTFEILQH